MFQSRSLWAAATTSSSSSSSAAMARTTTTTTMKILAVVTIAIVSVSSTPSYASAAATECERLNSQLSYTQEEAPRDLSGLVRFSLPSIIKFMVVCVFLCCCRYLTYSLSPNFLWKFWLSCHPSLLYSSPLSLSV